MGGRRRGRRGRGAVTEVPGVAGDGAEVGRRGRGIERGRPIRPAAGRDRERGGRRLVGGDGDSEGAVGTGMGVPTALVAMVIGVTLPEMMLVT